MQITAWSEAASAGRNPQAPRLSSQSSQALCMASQGPQASHTLRRRQIGQGRPPLAPWLRVPTGTGSGGPRITESPGSGARCDLMREWPECEYSVPPRVGTVRVFLSLYFSVFAPKFWLFFGGLLRQEQKQVSSTSRSQSPVRLSPADLDLLAWPDEGSRTVPQADSLSSLSTLTPIPLPPFPPLFVPSPWIGLISASPLDPSKAFRFFLALTVNLKVKLPAP